MKNKNHAPDIIVEGPVNNRTPRPAVIMIREFIWVVPSPRKARGVLCSRSDVIINNLWLSFKNYVNR